jgi:hypothetical protein
MEMLGECIPHGLAVENFNYAPPSEMSDNGLMGFFIELQQQVFPIKNKR